MINTRSGHEVFNEAMIEIMNPKMGIILPEWSKFTEYTGGLRMHEFTIFCGATGSGKTQWLASLVTQLVIGGVNCFVAPVETGDIDFATRMLSVVNGIDLNTGEKFAHKDFSDGMSKNMDAFTKNVFFSTHDNRVDVSEMIETLKYMVEINNVKVAVLDNLNFFLKPSRANEAVLVADEAIHEFVMLAKKLAIHIVLVMHPKKTDGGKITSEFDIKGSSTAVQEASNVLLMNRPSDEEIEQGINPLSREFVFRKIRKRGFNVGRKFYLEYRGGGYYESLANKGSVPGGPAYSSGNSSLGSSYKERKLSGFPRGKSSSGQYDL